MKNLFTIGFTQKTAEQFFTLLEENHVRCVIDVRLYNRTQLAGFSKYPDIKYFLDKISKIGYYHDLQFAPSEELLTGYKNKFIDWAEYVNEFNNLMRIRDIDNHIKNYYIDLDDCCLLCAENSPDYCHRRLVAERIRDVIKNVKIIHLSKNNYVEPLFDF